MKLSPPATPLRQNSVAGHFFNLLPKRLPLPTSTPSRRHNDIGLRTMQTSIDLPDKPFVNIFTALLEPAAGRRRLTLYMVAYIDEYYVVVVVVTSYVFLF
nr:protein IDA-LIKE 2-like [Ipomoea batatas]